MRRLLMCGMCAAAVVLTPGCSAVNDIVGFMVGRPVALEPADTMIASELDVRVWHVGAWWQALQAEAVEIVADPRTPESVRDAIRKAESAGSPVMLKVMLLAEAYGAARDAGAPLRDIEAAGDRLATGIEEANGKVVALGAAMGLELDPAREAG